MEPPEPEVERQPILVLSRKKPHLILFMVIVVLSGLVVFIEPPPDTAVPNWVAHAWAGLLLGTGSVSLLAHLQRWDRERGMYVERGSLMIQSAAVVCYGASLPSFLGWTPGVTLSLLAAAAWAGFNTWEVVLIGNDLDLIAQVREMGARSADATDD